MRFGSPKEDNHNGDSLAYRLYSDKFIDNVLSTNSCILVQLTVSLNSVWALNIDLFA